MSEKFSIVWTRSAQKDLASSRTPRRVADSVIMFAEGALAEEPFRVGKALDEPYRGLLSAYRGSYRVFYSVDDTARQVTVVAVRHRAKAYYYPG
ncbi:MAG: type II toxin-antitoxin system RelE/ParE family toxin [Acidimicrobiales bacterium]|nr:MAG: type II toxin-antitoxin system RelE/ParE family toxin [Acidimicrobiales bacterium]